MVKGRGGTQGRKDGYVRHTSTKLEIKLAKLGGGQIAKGLEFHT